MSFIAQVLQSALLPFHFSPIFQTVKMIWGDSLKPLQRMALIM